MSTPHKTAERRPTAPPGRPVPWRLTLIAALVCLASFAAFWIAQRVLDVSMIDLMVYRAQGWAVRDGRELYELRATHADLPATYPPFAALLFTSLTLLPVPGTRTLATAANLTLLVVSTHLCLRLVGRGTRAYRPAMALLISALLVWCEPVWTTLRYGQVNLLLAVLVLWDLSRRPSHRWAGVGIGIAAGIKLTPALFAVLLALAGLVQGWRAVRHAGTPRALWNHRLRQAAVATGTFLVTAATAAMVLPGESHRFWTRTLFEAGRVGNVEDTANQSVRGVVARLLHSTDPGLTASALAVAVGLLGLGTAIAALLAGPRLSYAPAWATTACAVTGLLFSPFSWSHHWVWCVLMVVLLGAEALRRASRASRRWWLATASAATLFSSYALWWVPHSSDRSRRLELHQNVGEMLLSAVYPLAGVAFLALAATVTLRALRENPQTAERQPLEQHTYAVAKE